MSESLQSFVDYSQELGQGMDIDALIVRGIAETKNQIRFSQNKIDINKQWSSKTLHVLMVVDGDRVTIGEFTPSSKDMVKNQLISMAKFAKHMPFSPFFKGITDTSEMYSPIPQQKDPRIDEYRDKAPEDVNNCIDRALEAGAKRVAGSYFFGKKTLSFASSAGPRGTYNDTFFNMTIRAFQEELDASGQGLACGCIPSKAENDLLVAGERAGRFSKMHQGAIQAAPGKYDIIMSPAVAANILAVIPRGASPFAVMMGMSPLEDKMGDKLGPEFVSVYDNGLQPDGLGTAPFDLEGYPRQNTPIFSDGVLVNFIHNTSTAELFQTESTGNSDLVPLAGRAKALAPSPSNTVFNNGDHNFDELLENGSRPTLYVTCNWYTRYTSRISTEYSTIPRDAAFLVENGELRTPVKNFRISDNILSHFANIDAMGNDRVQVEWWQVFVPTWIPTVRVRDCRITTATK
ncbi:MAG: TldD/PmbA family protein [Candidatus Thorarchaeota archaeon]